MPSESVELAIGDDTYDGELAVPEQPNGHGIVVRPGAGHGPYGDVFDRLAAEAADAGYHCLRFDSWPTREALAEETLTDIRREADAAIAHLRDAGCRHVSVVAKSFGGGTTLTNVPDGVERLVLWAPAVEYGDDANVTVIADEPLGDAPRPVVDDDYLADVDVPVRVFHGTEDEIPLENSRRIAAALPDGELVELDGEDHSFLNDTDPDVVAATLSFLN